jgi:magnesium-transporting ATPase (P-type)
MEQKPRDPTEPLLTKHFNITMYFRGVVMTVVILWIFAEYLGPVWPMWQEGWIATGGPDRAMTLEEAEDQVWWLYDFYIKRADSLGPWENVYTEWKARSVVFFVMMFAEMFNAYNSRSLYRSVFKIGFLNNKAMLVAVGISCVLTIILYIPGSALGMIFRVVPLGIEWLWLIPTFVVVIGSVELLKLKFRKELGLTA